MWKRKRRQWRARCQAATRRNGDDDGAGGCRWGFVDNGRRWVARTRQSELAKEGTTNWDIFGFYLSPLETLAITNKSQPWLQFKSPEMWLHGVTIGAMFDQLQLPWNCSQWVRFWSNSRLILAISPQITAITTI